MVNETIIVITVFLDLLFILLSLRQGKSTVVAMVVVNLILVSTFGSMLITVFGFTTNAGNVFYACTFFALNLLNEHFGKKSAFNGIWTGFMGLILFVILGQLTIRYIVPDNSVNTSIQTLFNLVPRISFASMLSYLIVQYFNAWLYDRLHQQYGRKMLWLRNNLSTLIAEAFDSIIFFTIAFIGVLSTSDLVQSIILGFILKSAVSLCSTPFMYLSYFFKND
jgi:uncharacterized integral membrane protein (TIGR00697 family)